MSNFEDALARGSAAVDQHFSECWLYQPMAVAGGDVGGRLSPDPDRPELPIVGVYVAPYARAFSAEARKQGVKPEHPGHASARPQLDLDVTQLPYRPRQSDRVVRLKTGELFHVAEPKFPSAGVRWQLDLNVLSPAREHR